MPTKNFRWSLVVFMVLYHIAIVVLLPTYFYFYSPSWFIIIAFILLFLATGISTTGAYHRLYSHRAYKVHKFAEYILLFFSTLAGQGSVLRWSFDHRLHHAYVDTDQDPYSIKKGFWYAHIFWLFEEEKPIEPRVISDLLKNKALVFQDRYFWPIFLVTNTIVSLIIGWLTGEYAGAFILTWLARLFLWHHCTWCINSLAHFWGSKTYCKELSAIDNYLISLLTFGEGYHNYHHAFATDYRNGIKWYHFDPTKWLIWTLSKLGLAHNLKTINNYKVKKCVIKKDTDLMLKWIKQISYIKTEVLEQKINTMARDIVAKISDVRNLVDEYQQSCKQKMTKDMRKQLRQEIKAMQKSLHQDWKEWIKLCKNILKLKTISV